MRVRKGKKSTSLRTYLPDRGKKGLQGGKPQMVTDRTKRPVSGKRKSCSSYLDEAREEDNFKTRASKMSERWKTQ